MNVQEENVKRSLLESSTDFSLALFRNTDAAKSVVLSPFSISMALCLEHAGALEKTEEQIRDIMLKGSTSTELSLYFSSLMKEVTNAKKVDFFLANRFYMRTGFAPYEEYLTKIRTNYLAEAVPINFSDSEKAAEEINSFVSECTKEKIKEVVTPEFVVDAVSLVVNALYLKADWQYKFSKAMTDTKPFYVKEGKQKMIPFMKQLDFFRYYKDADVQALTMNYSNPNFSFTVLLPAKKFGLTELRKSLTGKRLQEVLKQGREQKLQVTLPKMSIEFQMNLKEVLVACGIKDMFSRDDANFGAKCGKDIYCSEAIHKAVIEVDEEGTTATAVTVIKSVSRERITHVEFRANHPFMFVLCFKKNPIFIGQFIPEGNLEKATNDKESEKTDSHSEEECSRSSRRSPSPRKRENSPRRRNNSPRRSRYYQPYRYEKRNYRQRETYRNGNYSRRSPSYDRRENSNSE